MTLPAEQNSMRAFDDLQPGQLWSLLDLLRSFEPHEWLVIREYLAMLENSYDIIKKLHSASVPLEDQVDKYKENQKTFLNSLIKLSEAMSLRSSHELALQRAKIEILRFEEINILYDLFVDESGRNKYFFIEEDYADLWDKEQIVSDCVKKSRLSESVQDIRDAGSCLACGIANASVYHSMAALEIGARAIANELNITLAGHEDLKLVIDKIATSAKAISQEPRSDGKNRRSQHYSEVAVYSHNLKEAWRNHIAHARVRYSRAQAKAVLENVINFLEKAACPPGDSEQHS